MPYLALSKKHLLRISYHSFFGLRIDVNSYESLFDEVDDLIKEPDRLHQVQDSVTSINNTTFLLRGLYWVFNISDYRSNYYVMQCYYSNQLYEKGLLRFSGHIKQEVENIGGFIVSEHCDLFKSETALCLDEIDLSGKGFWFYKKIRHWFSNSILAIGGGVSKAQAVLDPVNHFTVTNSMLSHLKILQINANINDQVSFIDLKEARRTNLLRSHPDHNAGQEGVNTGTVQNIKEAFDALMNIIKNDCKSSTILASQEELLSKLDEAEKAFASAKQASDKYDATFNSYQKTASSFCEHAKKYSAAVDEVSSQASRLYNDFEQLNAKAGTYGDRVNKYSDRVDKYSDRVDKYSDRVDKYSKDVSQYKKDVSQYKKDVSQYSKDVAQYNQKVDECSAVIDELGQDVNDICKIHQENMEKTKRMHKALETQQKITPEEEACSYDSGLK